MPDVGDPEINCHAVHDRRFRIGSTQALPDDVERSHTEEPSRGHPIGGSEGRAQTPLEDMDDQAQFANRGDSANRLDMVDALESHPAIVSSVATLRCHFPRPNVL